MGLLFRAIFREVASSAILGAILFTFVLFLQRVGRLFEILVRSTAPPATVAHLFALAIPFTFTFTLPLGVLVGVLIALSRMSSDGEITAMRAAGVPSRKVIAPVLTFATLATILTAAATLWLTPYSTWRTYKILNQVVAAELTAEVQPRVFEENFPNRIVYVSEVIPGTLTHWRNVFIADLTPQEERKKDDHDHGDGPRITVASEAIAVPDVARNVIQMSLNNGVSYDVGKDITQYFTTDAPKEEQILQATKPNEVHAKDYIDMDTLPLYRIAYHDPTLEPDKRTEARIELHQRLALPPACFLLALIGIPLGVSSRKGGKSSAFVLTVALAFIYWIGMLGANGLAKQHKLPVGVAVWIPNAVFALIGIVLLTRLERPGDRDWVGRAVNWIATIWARLRGRLPAT
jgi:LPS export ABC transporter permease LptF